MKRARCQMSLNCEGAEIYELGLWATPRRSIELLLSKTIDAIIESLATIRKELCRLLRLSWQAQQKQREQNQDNSASSASSVIVHRLSVIVHCFY